MSDYYYDENQESIENLIIRFLKSEFELANIERDWNHLIKDTLTTDRITKYVEYINIKNHHADRYNVPVPPSTLQLVMDRLEKLIVFPPITVKSDSELSHEIKRRYDINEQAVLLLESYGAISRTNNRLKSLILKKLLPNVSFQIAYNAKIYKVSNYKDDLEITEIKKSWWEKMKNGI